MKPAVDEMFPEGAGPYVDLDEVRVELIFFFFIWESNASDVYFRYSKQAFPPAPVALR